MQLEDHGNVERSNSTCLCPRNSISAFRNADGEEKQPVMIHRAVFVDDRQRFFGISDRTFRRKIPSLAKPRTCPNPHQSPTRHLPLCRRVVRQCAKPDSARRSTTRANQFWEKSARSPARLGELHPHCRRPRSGGKKRFPPHSRQRRIHGAITMEHLLEKLEEERSSKAFRFPFSATSA